MLSLFENLSLSLKSSAGKKSAEAFRTISEVSQLLDVKPHVLRFWEGKFKQISPVKASGNRRYYRQEDILILAKIRDLLYKEGFTVKGAQQALTDALKQEKKATSSEPIIEQSADSIVLPNEEVQVVKSAFSQGKRDALIDDIQASLMDLKAFLKSA
ncbi:MAG: MerR family transcriptional regulator [Alphaproteobacteria bacterium]|jgi:DNA-binding transcriptional MerR regulator|nr:MerR family transcriptional regulator [Alphaproteobacteria bacterium]MBP9877366.1 MerR family transcriptional regulator [Alphaproteobacteria bacterium]